MCWLCWGLLLLLLDQLPTLTPCAALNLRSSPRFGEFLRAKGLRVSIVSTHTLHPVIQINLQQQCQQQAGRLTHQCANTNSLFLCARDANKRECASHAVLWRQLSGERCNCCTR